MPDASEKNHPQNPFQKEVILDLLVCVEKCRHPKTLNMHSLCQGQFSVPMSNATEGAVHMFKKTYHGIELLYAIAYNSSQP